MKKYHPDTETTNYISGCPEEQVEKNSDTTCVFIAEVVEMRKVLREGDLWVAGVVG